MTRLETRIRLVDDVYAPLTADQAVFAVTFAQGAQRITDFHGSVVGSQWLPGQQEKVGRNLWGAISGVKIRVGCSSRSSVGIDAHLKQIGPIAETEHRTGHGAACFVKLDDIHDAFARTADHMRKHR